VSSTSDQLKKTVVRLHYAGPDGRTFGSGVIVARNAILTARHVLDPNERSLHGEPVIADAISVESTADFCRREVDRVYVPASADIDLAVACVESSKALPQDFCCSVRATPFDAFSIGDEADVFGFESEDGGLQMDKLRVLSVHPRAGAYICNKAVPRGYSGGPVFIDGGLVGVLYAREHDQGQTFFYGVGQLRGLFEHARVEVQWIDHDLSGLRAYPLGPGIGISEIYSRLAHIIDAYLELYQGEAAQRVVSAANEARSKCGPNTGAKGTIGLHDLPNPLFAPRAFWQGAFVEAGKKSPRMLAALLNAVDNDLLPVECRAEKAKFLDEIKNRPH
jgi:hypothetical protein